MANGKKMYCYTYDVLMNNTICEKEKLFKIINNMFSEKEKNVTKFENGNKVFIFQDSGNNYSLELLKEVNEIEVEDGYMFFRIGRQKEIEGALKRNKKTFISEEILSKEQQEKYDIEICTYILIDKRNGIILELFGQFAPSIKTFIDMMNSFLPKEISNKKVSIKYKNILTEKMIESFKEDGVRLGRIEYTYNIPSARVLNNLGLDMEQIKALEELDVFQVEIKIKNRPKVPLTKLPEKIKYTIKAFKDCAKEIKDTVVFNGRSGKLGSKDYSFKEEEVTYPINITNNKKQDNLIIKLTLDEMAEQVYNKMKDIYEANMSKVLEYIK
ncbi:hypothetical protein G8S49_01605 [Clostridium botulinum C]|uniref:Uncharacterized protein n=2 Tax=Clostridium botulinum TaxID=1491 RepID=A0A9Q4TIV3_CLOBO|nr:hypothetical protein [Clostridium botulinum]EGO87445.1 hypothetical protein CBCST_11872 [Clostridium botulinum C str. Stockholm]MCD3194271.1 hypothetical protein [Clostridium botulinum C]MCD3199100.1 hypothetical protein [Clostridium botulinum C]MCD3204575.1 hypothetical protein [Clostridium botulinum C]MCD3208596.1 hypothetical protein [Clostridium botulinum C]